MKVLVTGATGFIGRALCLSLAEKGYMVNALCRQEDHPWLPRHENIRPYKGDITYGYSLLKVMQGCQQVYHTAALAKMWCRDKQKYHKVNVVGTQNVLDAAAKMGIGKIVYTSTCGVWGPTLKHPMTENDPRIVGFPIDYERTKYLAELEVLARAKEGLNVVTVNPSRVYGKGPITDSNTVSKMVKGYLNGSWRFIPGDGSSISNYAFLDDVVSGHIAAMEKGLSGERYIMGGEDISFNDFFDTLKLISGEHKMLIKLPQKLIKAYSHIESAKAKLTGLAPVFLPEFADRLKYDQKYSSQKAIDQLNYRITPFAEGLAQTIQYLKDTCKN